MNYESYDGMIGFALIVGIFIYLLYSGETGR